MASNDRYINIGMGLDIQDLRTGLSEAKREMANAEAEFKATTAGLDKWSDSIEGVEAKLTQMTREMEAKRRIVDAYRQELARVTEAYGENSAKAQEVQTKLLNAEAAYVKAEKYTEDLKDRLAELKREQGSASTGADTLKEKLRSMGDSASEAVKGGLSKLKEHLTDMAKNAVSSLVNGLKEFAKQVVDAGKEYTSTMSEVRAISGAGVEEFKKLQEAARNAGNTTIYSANEAAEALKYMALAGWDADQSAEALGGILDLASASGLDLAKTSDIVTDNLTAFGLEAQDAARFADALAFAQGNSNTSVAQLAEAYKSCASVMSADGQTFETTTALLSKLADAGVKGSTAGTGLAAVMRDLTKKMDEGAIAIGETSVQVTDADGNFRSLTDILVDVEAATVGMGSAEKATALQTTFTSEAIKTLSTILNQGASSVAGFEKELQGSNGTAKEMSDIMNDNLAGDMKKMDARMTELKLRLFELIEGPLRGLVQFITDTVPAIISFGEDVYDFFVGVYNATKPFWDALGGWLAGIWAQVEKFAGDLGKTIDIVSRAFGELGGWLDGVAKGAVRLFEDPWGAVKSFFEGIWNGIKGAFSGVLDFFGINGSEAVKAFEQAWHLVVKFYEGIWNGIKGVFTDPVGTFRSLGEGMWNGLKGAFSGVTDFFGKTFGGAVDAIKGVFGGIKSFFEGIFNGIVGVFRPILEFFGIKVGGGQSDPNAELKSQIEQAQKEYESAQKAYSTAQDSWWTTRQTYGYGSAQERAAYDAYNSRYSAMTAASKKLSDLQAKLKSAEQKSEGKDGLGGIKDSVKSAFSGITDIITKPFTDAWNGITKLFGGIGDWFSKNVLGPVGDALGGIVGAAGEVVGGVADGIAKGAGGVVDGIVSFGNDVVNGFTSFFRINSPSRLMRDKVGLMIGEGVAEGIRDSARAVSRASDELSGSVGLGGGRGRIGGATVVYNQTINSPSPLTAGQIYRDTRSLIGRREWE